MENKASVVKVPTLPVVVKKGSRLSLLKNNLLKNDLMRCIKLGAVTKDQLIYKSVPGDFLRGEFPGLTLISRLNLFNNTSSTVAKFNTNDGSGKIIEKTSHEVIKVIGQNNYDTVFSALCSVISQELRIRAILALLTIEGNNINKKASVQTEKSYTEFSCQTDETSKNILNNFKQPKRVRRQQFRPYIVKEEDKKIKRVVIDPKFLLSSLGNPTQTNTTCTTKSNEAASIIDVPKCTPKNEINSPLNESFPDLKGIVNEDSSFSDISIGNISLSSQLSLNCPQLLDNPFSLFDNVDNHTETLNIVPLTLLDGSEIMVCAKPMDKFHWATPEILKNLSYADKCKLMYQQAFIHWKYCMESDDDGYLPIHQAVMTNDLVFLSRQCAALVKKYGSVDVPATGNMTALQMSTYSGGERCAALLLRSGADPCLQDDDGRNFFHKAAEVSGEHLHIALEHCRANARTILKEDEDLWSPDMESQSDGQLAATLLDHICVTCDNQGYTPLMLASKLGWHENVKLLLSASPDTVNRPMPNCGSTALYLAVEAACIETSNSNNQTKISEKFMKTIEYLMESGGDPSLENHFGSSVNILLTEFNNVDLSVLIANKLTSVKYFDGKTFAANNIGSLMLIKNSDGKVNCTEIKHMKANGDTKDVNAASTSNISKSGAETKSTDGKVKDNKGRKRNRTVNINKDSNVEIKEIKTITLKEIVPSFNATPSEDHQFIVPTAVTVKPSHFIIVSKAAQAKAEVPKYVKILPKLNNQVTDESAKTEVRNKAKHNITATAGHRKQNVTASRKHKKNTASEQTTAKKQRKDSQHVRKKKMNDSLSQIGTEQSASCEVDGNN